jgi:hypothetical protein
MRLYLIGKLWIQAIFLIVLQTLVEELKRHLDDRIQMQIGVFTQTYNDDVWMTAE